MSKVCAIVPTYNRANYIGECLDSLLNQSRPLYQIIVVNDGASDNTDEVMEAYLDRVTYLKKENGGKSSALNLAFQHTDADYIWVCDDDDYADKDALGHMMKAFEANPHAGYVFGTFKIFTEDKSGERTYRDPYFWKREEEQNLKINFLEMMFTYQFAMLVKREAYEKAGPFNEELVRSQDYDMTLRLTRYHTGAEIPNVIFYQREHDGARGTGAAKFSAADKMKKWMEYDQKFFTGMISEYALDEFCPSFAAAWEEGERIRATHLQRAMIFGKRALWEDVTSGIEAGIAASNTPLTSEEQNILEKIIRTHTAWLALKDMPHTQKKLRALYTGSPLGKSILLAMFRPLMWLIKKAVKQKDFKTLFSYISIMQGVLGVGGVITRVRKSVMKQS